MISGLSHLRSSGGLVPALPSSILEPFWVQVAALLPTRQVSHPLGCHRPRIADRVAFDKLTHVLGCSAAATGGSPITPARPPPCAAAGMSGPAPGWPSNYAWPCWPPTTAYSACAWTTGRWTAAPPRRPAAARPPAQARSTGRKQGLKRSAVPLPERPTVHLDAGLRPPALPGCPGRAGHGRQDRRSWGASPDPSRPPVGDRAHPRLGNLYGKLPGAPSAAGAWSSPGWRWPTPPSSAAGSSAWTYYRWPGRPRRHGVPNGGRSPAPPDRVKSTPRPVLLTKQGRDAIPELAERDSRHAQARQLLLFAAGLEEEVLEDREPSPP